MSSLSLRPISRNDLDRVSEVESRIAGHQRRAFLEKRFAVAAARPESFITCAATEGGNLVGYAFARPQEGEFGTAVTVAALDVIGVDPNFQGRGVGKALIAEIEQQLKKKNIATLRTQIDWANPCMTSFFSSAGFHLAPSRIIERETAPLDEDPTPSASEADPGRDYPMAARGRVLLRSLRDDDLAAVVRIDSKLLGRDRSAYYAAKFREVLEESGVRVSLAAVEGGFVTGYIMARVDFGEFGKIEKAAVIDTIGVHPSFQKSGVGQALLSRLLVNLAALQVESVRTQVSWKNIELQRFLQVRGFGPTQSLVLTRAVS